MAANSEAVMEEAAALHPAAAAAEVDTELELEVERAPASSQPWRSRRMLRHGLLAGAGLLAAVVVAASLRGARSGGALRASAAERSGELLVAAEDVAAERRYNHNSAVKKVPDQGMGWPLNTQEPTLFCWSVMNCQNQAEIDTIKGQLRHRIGIFQCDNVAVISGCKMIIGEGHKLPNGSSVQVETWLNPAQPVPMGNLQAGDDTNSFKNSDIFIRAWNMLVKSKAVFGHDWTVKCDPDAVFFAHRARWHLKKHPINAPAYIRNCNWQGTPKLFGAVEVVNELAMRRYDARGPECMNLDWMHWGEDQWIATCMEQTLQVMPLDDFEIVGDHRCMSAECGDTWRAGFHDYKSWAAYKNCWDTSTNAEKQKATLSKEKNFCCTFSSDKSNPCGACGTQVMPGGGFCGDSEGNCHNCGPSATWCKRVDGKGMPA